MTPLPRLIKVTPESCYISEVTLLQLAIDWNLIFHFIYRTACIIRYTYQGIRKKRLMP